jgi:hypothetical protein
MQFIADVLNIPVMRPMAIETVSLGAAYAAGLAVGYWPDLEVLHRNWHRAAQWLPAMNDEHRETEYENWHRAVERAFGWIKPTVRLLVRGRDRHRDYGLDATSYAEQILILVPEINVNVNQLADRAGGVWRGQAAEGAVGCQRPSEYGKARVSSGSSARGRKEFRRATLPIRLVTIIPPGPVPNRSMCRLISLRT